MATNPYMNPLNTPTTAGVSNPYLPAMGRAIAQQTQQNLTRNILPALGRQGVAMGGFGDSRQGIAEGIAAGDAQQGVTNALAGLYGQAYGQDRQYDLGRIGQDQSFYTAQRGQDLQQQGQNFNQYLGALNAQVGLGQQMTNIGQQQYLQGFTPYQMFGGLLNNFTGLNNSTQGSPTGGGLGGALGGGLTVAQLLKLIGG